MKDLSNSTGARLHNRMRSGELVSGLRDALLHRDNLETVLTVAIEAAGRLQFEFADGSYAAVSLVDADRYFVEYGEVGTGPVQ